MVRERVSLAGTVGGFSVASLQGKLEALYDPNAEELGPYLLRMGRVIGALNNLGQAAPDGALEMVTRKAELMIEVYAEFGVLDKPKAVRYLRDKFMAFSVDDALDPHEKENSIVALGELIQQLGGKPSRQDSKLFSTPSDGKNGSQAEARGPSGRGLNVGPIPTAVGSPARSEAGSETKLRAKLAAAEIELEALRQEKVESEAGGSGVGERGLVAAMEEQTKVLKEALAGRGKDSTVTAVKTDLHWPTLGDDRSDFRDVSLFYEEFEDICALANSCRGMNERERLLALRARCRGSRLKTYTNVYRAAWNSGEVLEDPGGVYQRIKSKHLIFSESREERPEPDLASTDEDDNVEKGARAASKEPEAEKRDLGLRVKRKRAGSKHPKKKKRCRCGKNRKVRGGACVSRLSRGPGSCKGMSARRILSLFWFKSLRLPRAVRHGSRREWNRRQHSLNGNEGYLKLGLLLGLLPLARKLEWEAEAVIEAASSLAVRSLEEVEAVSSQSIN